MVKLLDDQFIGMISRRCRSSAVGVSLAELRPRWKFDQSDGVRGAAWLAYHLIIALTGACLL